jgi:hypothetical protein
VYSARSPTINTVLLVSPTEVSKRPLVTSRYRPGAAIDRPAVNVRSMLIVVTLV